MAKVDYATLKKGGFMRQKQKNNFSLRLACVGGALTAENLKKIAEVAEKYGDGYVHKLVSTVLRLRLLTRILRVAAYLGICIQMDTLTQQN